MSIQWRKTRSEFKLSVSVDHEFNATKWDIDSFILPIVLSNVDPKLTEKNQSAKPELYVHHGHARRIQALYKVMSVTDANTGAILIRDYKVLTAARAITVLSKLGLGHLLRDRSILMKSLYESFSPDRTGPGRKTYYSTEAVFQFDVAHGSVITLDKAFKGAILLPRFSEVPSEFYEFINDPNTCKPVLKLLSERFNAVSFVKENLSVESLVELAVDIDDGAIDCSFSDLCTVFNHWGLEEVSNPLSGVTNIMEDLRSLITTLGIDFVKEQRSAWVSAAIYGVAASVGIKENEDFKDCIRIIFLGVADDTLNYPEAFKEDLRAFLEVGGDLKQAVRLAERGADMKAIIEQTKDAIPNAIDDGWL